MKRTCWPRDGYVLWPLDGAPLTARPRLRAQSLLSSHFAKLIGVGVPGISGAVQIGNFHESGTLCASAVTVAVF
jgi:hypothetical protein